MRGLPQPCHLAEVLPNIQRLIFHGLKPRARGGLLHQYHTVTGFAILPHPTVLQVLQIHATLSVCSRCRHSTLPLIYKETPSSLIPVGPSPCIA